MITTICPDPFTRETFRPMPAVATVFVVDDDPAVRRSMMWLLESIPVPVEAYESAAAFLKDHDPSRPGCVICDVRMPGMSGLELLEQLRDRRSTIPVIMVTGYGDVPTAVRAMHLGAVDFLEKPAGDQVLIERVRHWIERHTWTLQEQAESEEIQKRLRRLTDREHEVMTFVVEGDSSKEIAVQLGVSFKTVEAHRAKIMRKMRAGSVPQLIKMVLKVRPAGSNGTLSRSRTTATERTAAIER